MEAACLVRRLGLPQGEEALKARLRRPGHPRLREALAASLKRLEAPEEVFRALAERFGTLRLETEELEYAPSIQFRSLTSLPVAWD